MSLTSPGIVARTLEKSEKSLAETAYYTDFTDRNPEEQFLDDLIKNGSLPISVVEWILLDDPTAIQQATK
jgi:hypothetical protein